MSDRYQGYKILVLIKNNDTILISYNQSISWFSNVNTTNVDFFKIVEIVMLVWILCFIVDIFNSTRKTERPRRPKLISIQGANPKRSWREKIEGEIYIDLYMVSKPRMHTTTTNATAETANALGKRLRN